LSEYHGMFLLLLLLVLLFVGFGVYTMRIRRIQKEGRGVIYEEKSIQCIYIRYNDNLHICIFCFFNLDPKMNEHRTSFISSHHIVKGKRRWKNNPLPIYY
jgi:hypothetical protein